MTRLRLSAGCLGFAFYLVALWACSPPPDTTAPDGALPPESSVDASRSASDAALDSSADATIDSSAPDATIDSSAPDASAPDATVDSSAPDASAPDATVDSSAPDGAAASDASISDSAAEASDAWIAGDASPSSTILCSRHIGGTGYQFGAAIATDVHGNVIVVGSNTGTSDFGGTTLACTTTQCAFMAKYDSSCALKWVKQFGDYAAFSDVGTDANGNIVVAGNNRGTVNFGGGPLATAGNYDIVIAAFDTDANPRWSKQFGDSSSQVVNAIGVAPDGSVTFGSTCSGNVSFGGSAFIGATSGTDIYLAKLDAQGAHLWSTGFFDPSPPPDSGTGPHDHQVLSVAVDTVGNVVMCSFFSGHIDLGGGPLSPTSSGNACAGYSPTGAFAWERYFDGTAAVSGGTFDPAGSYIAPVSVPTAQDFGTGTLPAGHGLIQYLPNGTVGWAKTFSTSTQGTMSTATARIGPTGAIAVNGYFYGSADFGGAPKAASAPGDNLFLAQFDGSGAYLAASTYGPPIPGSPSINDTKSSIAYEPTGELVMVGNYVNYIKLGTAYLPNSEPSTSDFFIVKYGR